MSGHLGNDEISSFVLGDANEAERIHVRQCAECRREVERFERMLSGLRGSIRQWSNTEFAAREMRPVRPAAVSNLSLAFALICLLVLIVVGTKRVAATPAVSDDVLLRQVSTDVVNVVPAGMEALAPATLQ